MHGISKNLSLSLHRLQKPLLPTQNFVPPPPQILKAQNTFLKILDLLIFKQLKNLGKSCLASSFRTTLACTIVGCTTIYGPAAIRRHITLPAFSYVTVILIITDASLGDTFRGCWHALYATVQGVGPAILCLWALGPTNLTTTTTSVAVAVGAFVVVLPENTHLVAKRIALGQIVLVYVTGFINGVHTEPVMHPVHVAASTAVGVLACVSALMFPFPSLACYEVKQNCGLFVENVSERLKLFVKAFCEEDNTSAGALFSQAKSMAVPGTKLLQNIKSKQESMQWERLAIKFLKPCCTNPGEKFQEIETTLKGMSIALTSCYSFPVTMLNPELKDGLQKLEENIHLTFTQLKNCMPFNLSTIPESDADNLMISLQTIQTISPPANQKDLPPFFFLFCFERLQNKLLVTPSYNPPQKEAKSIDSGKNKKGFLDGLWINKRFMPAFKCSLSLFLAVLFGLIYSKEDGYWAGLPVAISLASGREATFKVANVKAQGTVLGTVYGVLGCFVFEKYVKIRFVSLLPWFIFTTLLRRSRMYGQAGGISAVIGAVLILGRKNFGTPSDFAIARIVETFIGLTCSIMVDVVFHPTRASTLAKIQLSKSLNSLHECVGTINLSQSCMDKLEESQKGLKFHVNELRKFIGEAEVEPNFWFLPFDGASYNKILGSLSKMGDFLIFGTHAIGFIQKEIGKMDGDVWREIVTQLDGDLELLKEMAGSSLKCFGEIILIKSLARLEKELRKNNASFDLELGKSSFPIMLMSSGNSAVEDEIGKVISSCLRNSKEILNKVHADEGEGEGEEEMIKSQTVLGLSALAFCMSSLVRETKVMEKAIKELIRLENPSSHVNLYEIYCKIDALYN